MNLVKETIPKLIPLWRTKKTHRVLWGGRGGAKSWEANDYLLISALNNPGKIFLSTREIQKSIKKSNYATLKRRIRELGLQDFFHVKSDMIACINGAEIHFEGLHHNIDTVLSMDNMGGIHLEEASFISRNSYDLLIPTAVRYPDIFFIHTFNPRFREDPVYQMFLASDKERIEDFPYDYRTKYDKDGNIISEPALIINVNWTDNVHLMKKDDKGDWVYKEWHEEVRLMYEHDEEFANHIYGGALLTRSNALVYKRGTHWDIDEDGSVASTIPKHARRHVCCDLGFNDPTAVLEVSSWGRNLYVHREHYQRGIPADDVPHFVKRSDWARQGVTVSVDPASKQIAEMLAKPKFKLNIRKARKGPMSILEGITFLWGYKVWVDKSCVDTIEEYKHYSYEVKEDTGEILVRKNPVDAWNHSMDGIRYICEELREPGHRETSMGGRTRS